jgi:hypothetical protein
MRTSFIIHYLGWQVRKRSVGHLFETASIRSSELLLYGIPSRLLKKSLQFHSVIG